ncbi:hypothetical protein AJ80_03903 [Polytolypa hystricis UAMH7299]|uniref:Uncharacterized protein n=1 Tax=Polytolypa hystricis (strain UAMH7299) TaxID=1447883 RepID=A0A2B7YG33_POLH7|nr:hypothetical protein AJ80_03903 [Polytolypa hystricis UAMH7299]
MATATTSLSTSTTVSSTPTVCGNPSQYEIPVKDASCAIPNSDKNLQLLSRCCNSFPVRSYDHDCAIYCVAGGQSVEDLTKCLFDAKIPWQDVWCSGEMNATATGTEVPTSTKGAGGDGDDSDDDEASRTGTPSASATGNAAPDFFKSQPASKAVWAVSMMLLSGIAFGTLL